MREKTLALLLLAISAAALFANDAARADVVISKKPTANMSCSAGVCSPTAANAVLNATDLTNMLASGDVKVMTGSGAAKIVVKDAFSWTATSRLTLDTNQSVEFDKPVTVAGTGAVTITTNDGGKNGEFIILPEHGSIQFWDMSSSLIIDGQTYTLVGDIKALAADIAANPSGFYALAKPYDASTDGTYTSAPVQTTFSGAFYGLGNPISNLAIRFPPRGVGVFVGLFQNVDQNGSIRAVGLENVDIEGTTCNGLGVGAVAAVSSGLVEGSWAVGKISTPHSCDGSIGALIGGNGGRLINSYAAVRMTISGGIFLNLGGLVGDNFGAIVASYSNGRAIVDDSSDSSVGGLIGLNEKSVKNVFSLTSVREEHDCCQSDNLFGGLVGQNTTQATVASSYSAGNFAQARSADKSAEVGGFVGQDDSDAGSITSSYWDLDKGVGDPSKGAGNRSNDIGITGLTDAQLKLALPAGFDPTIWGEKKTINNGYPYLLANPPPH